MGAEIRIMNVECRNGELVGELVVKSSAVRGGTIEKETTAALIDEVTDVCARESSSCG